MEKVEKKLKFNWFDVVVIVIIACVLFMLSHILQREEVFETTNVTYTLELIDNEVGFADSIEIGETLIDNINQRTMGVVVDVEVKPTTTTAYNRSAIDPTSDELVPIIELPLDNREVIIVTVEAPLYDDGLYLKTQDGFTVCAGLSIAVRGKEYAGRGYILHIDRDSVIEKES